MKQTLAIAALIAWVAACAACATTTSPSPTPPSSTTVTFGGLTANNATMTTYVESGVTVSALAGGWSAAASSAVTGEILVTAGGEGVAAGAPTFSFSSVDLYSSVTPIPYTIVGLRHSTTMFTLAATLPNTLGRFVTVANPQATAVIDTLLINLSNFQASCPTCINPVGLDNIVVVK
jgi:hypothetical protein